MNLTVNEEVQQRAEVVVLKYLSDQRRFPDLRGQPFVTTAAEFEGFMNAVREANPQIPEEQFGRSALMHQKSDVADAIMGIIQAEAEKLRKGDRELPPIPDLFDRDPPAASRGRG